MNMSQYEEVYNLIQKTINSVYTMKSFMENVLSLLGHENDTTAITEIKASVDKAEEEIYENLKTLSKQMSKKRLCSTPNKINSYKVDRPSLKKRKIVSNFQAIFKSYLYLYAFDIRCKSLQIDLRLILENMKKSFKKVLMGIENFEYFREEKKYRVKIRFLFGLEVTIYSETGRIESYSLQISSQSIILNQLLSLFEVFWQLEVNLSNWNLQAVIQKASRWLEIRKKIYSEKCRICDMHLSFKSGTPMLPLAVLHNNYYHIDCFYDYQF